MTKEDYLLLVWVLIGIATMIISITGGLAYFFSAYFWHTYIANTLNKNE